MVEITEINRMPNQVFNIDGTIELLGYFISVNFLLFGKIICSCEFKTQDLELDIKTYIENQLKEDFKGNTQQLEGKPSNLKTK